VRGWTKANIAGFGLRFLLLDNFTEAASQLLLAKADVVESL
jgi:hypothetical protein